MKRKAGADAVVSTKPTKERKAVVANGRFVVDPDAAFIKEAAVISIVDASLLEIGIPKVLISMINDYTAPRDMFSPLQREYDHASCSLPLELKSRYNKSVAILDSFGKDFFDGERDKVVSCDMLRFQLSSFLTECRRAPTSLPGQLEQFTFHDSTMFHHAIRHSRRRGYMDGFSAGRVINRPRLMRYLLPCIREWRNLWSTDDERTFASSTVHVACSPSGPTNDPVGFVQTMLETDPAQTFLAVLECVSRPNRFSVFSDNRKADELFIALDARFGEQLRDFLHGSRLALVVKTRRRLNIYGHSRLIVLRKLAVDMPKLAEIYTKWVNLVDSLIAAKQVS